MDYDKLRAVMRFRKMSRAELASLIGIPYDTFISAVARKSQGGRLNTPAMMLKIASVLNCDVQEFMTAEEKLALQGIYVGNPSDMENPDGEASDAPANHSSAAQLYAFAQDYYSAQCEKRLLTAFRSLSSNHDKLLAVSLIETIATESMKIDKLFEEHFMKENTTTQNNEPEDK